MRIRIITNRAAWGRAFLPFLCLSLLCLTPFPDPATGNETLPDSDSSMPQEMRNPPAPARRDIISGTGSPDIYHFHDPYTDSEVWGVSGAIMQDQSPPPPPIYITPEIAWPNEGQTSQKPDWQPGQYPGWRPDYHPGQHPGWRPGGLPGRP